MQTERKEPWSSNWTLLDNHFEKIDQFLKTATPRTRQGKRSKEVKSNPTDNESAKMTTSKGTIQASSIATVDKRAPDHRGRTSLWRGARNTHRRNPCRNRKSNVPGARASAWRVRQKASSSWLTPGNSNEDNNAYLEEEFWHSTPISPTNAAQAKFKPGEGSPARQTAPG
ncbi:MAG: hypothetical protein IPG06_25080 [Haliea sp.]|nr:hypothetical protein [Haliea sp.]